MVSPDQHADYAAATWERPVETWTDMELRNVWRKAFDEYVPEKTLREYVVRLTIEVERLRVLLNDGTETER